MLRNHLKSVKNRRFKFNQIRKISNISSKIENELTLEKLKNNKIDENDEKYIDLREKAVLEIRKNYLSKIENSTEWRLNYNEKLSRRKIPLPFSLTGFGDSSLNTRFWVQKIKENLFDIYENKIKNDYFQKLPTTVQYFLEKQSDKLDPKYKLLIERFEKEKENLIKETALVEVKNLNENFNLPFNFSENLKQKFNLEKPVEENKEILDEDFEKYKKHHHFLEFIANKFQKSTNYEVAEELIGLSNAIWQRDYGTENSKIKPSNIPCYGCGSNLHCTSTNIPGYLPYEIYTEKLSKKKLNSTLCQRCDYLNKYNISLNVNVEPKVYEEIISNLKTKKGIVLFLVDVTDFPCSFNPKILDLIGDDKKIIFVVNKIDLIPKDGNNYLDRVKETLVNNFNLNRKINKKDLILISAKTGFGLDNLISFIYQNNGAEQDIFLLGCTNVGKSTLFNSFLQSELCKLRQYDLIQRATTSVWPGTTLNLLKFPIRPLPEWEKEIRKRRFFLKNIKNSINEIDLRKSMKYQDDDKKLFMKLENRTSSTFIKEIPFKAESNHPFSQLAKQFKPFSGDHIAFKNSKFLYDTPGTIFDNQILSLLTTEELLKTLPRQTIRPRTFTLYPFQTLFLAGLGRIDLLHSTSHHILVTVFASDYLPVHIVNLEEAYRFYEFYLNSDYLGVPIGTPERIKNWPSLISKDFHIKNDKFSHNEEMKSCCDIVLSSAGWVSFTLQNQKECIIKAYTPEGRGIFHREPSILPRTVLFRGPKIKGTPCFEPHSSFIKELDIPKKQPETTLPVYLNKKLLNSK